MHPRSFAAARFALTSSASLVWLALFLSLAACGSTATGTSTTDSSTSDTSTLDGAGGDTPTVDGAPGDAPAPDTSTADTTAADARSETTTPEVGGDVAAGDPLVTSFVFVGCNRLQKADWDPVANPSSANVGELQQTFTDVAAMPTTPKFFFFTGDMTLALKQDTTVLSGQLEGWASLWSAAPLASKSTLLAMPGNHEMLYKDVAKNELSNGPANAVWTTWLTAHGFDAKAGNGPTNTGSNADALQDDQSKLTYSFDDGGVHYVLLNTDTWTTSPDATTGSTKIGWIALEWLKADLAAAQANVAISSIFVFGHKPLINPTGGTGGKEQIEPTLGTPMMALLDSTTKVKGYLCAHAHEWNAQQLPGARGVYQIVAGNGGSQLDSTWAAGSPFYGYTEVRLYGSGRVDIVSWQRPVPTPYNATTVAAATAASALTITK